MEKKIPIRKECRHEPNDKGNEQCERYNGVIRKAIQLVLENWKLPIRHREDAIAEALYVIRTMLSTSTNTNPNEKFLKFSRRSSVRTSFPSWLSQPGTVLENHVRQSKYDSPVCEAHAFYSHVQHPDGRHSNISLREGIKPEWVATMPLDSDETEIDTSTAPSKWEHTSTDSDSQLSEVERPTPIRRGKLLANCSRNTWKPRRITNVATPENCQITWMILCYIKNERGPEKCGKTTDYLPCPLFLFKYGTPFYYFGHTCIMFDIVS